MTIVLLAEAQRRFEAEDEWWRENRDAKDLFMHEFEQTLEQLGANPDIGQAYRLTRGKLIRRVLMKKTRSASCPRLRLRRRSAPFRWRSRILSVQRFGLRTDCASNTSRSEAGCSRRTNAI